MNLISIGELISQGWKFYTKNFKMFFQIILWLLILQIFSALLIIFNLPILVSLLSLVTAIIGIWTSIVLILVINNLYNQKPFDLKSLYKVGWQKFLSYLWVSILAGVITLIGFVLFIIPGIILFVWFAFATYIVVLEDMKGKETLSKSKELSKGRWWATFGRILLPNLFYGIILYIIIIALLYLGSALSGVNLAQAMQQTTVWWTQLIVGVLPVLSVPLFVSIMTMLYNSLKKTKTEPSATEKMELPKTEAEKPQV